MTAQSHGTSDGAAVRSAADENPRPRRKWLWGLGVVVILIAVALLLAPGAVARHLEAEGYALQDESGRTFQLRADEISLGWLSPVRIEGLSLHEGDWTPDDGVVDPLARRLPLLEAPSVVSRRSFLSLLLNQDRLGRWIVRQPQVNVAVRTGGSNLEDFIEFLIDRRSGDAGSSELAITATDGRIDFYDSRRTTTGGAVVGVAPLGSVQDVDLACDYRAGADREIDFEWTSTVEYGDESRSVSAAAHWTGPRDGLPLITGTGSAAIEFEPLPVRLLQPHVERVLPQLTIDNGRISGRLLVECDVTDARKVIATGQLVTTDVRASTSGANGQIQVYQWDTEEVALHANGTFDPSNDAVTFSEVTVQSTPVTISAAGTVSDVYGESVVDLSGRLQYDVSPLADVLLADYGRHVSIEGLQTRSVRVHGPLADVVDGRPRWDLSRLSVETDVRWSAADVFGVRSEQAILVARLEEGVLTLEPSPVPVSGGQLTARPFVTLFEEDPNVHIPEGPALQGVALSPEMCRLWLKYLSPPMSDATQINGSFSIYCDGGQIPLEKLTGGELRGTLHVHSAELRPGPFAERVIGIVGTIQELISGRPGWSLSGRRRLIGMDDQRIPFVMEKGRVRHENLEFTVAGTPVRTSGSIGFDESLDLVVAVPLPESWLTKNDLRSVIGGEAIQIPVRGTLDRPQFDLLALRELARRAAIRASGGLLRKLLD